MTWQKLIFKYLIRAYRVAQRLLGAASVGVRTLVISPKNEILLVEHTYIDGWHFPGGGVNHMEPMITAAKRELEEEAGIIANELSLFNIYVHNIRGISDHAALYIVKDYTEKPQKQFSMEIKQAKWFALDDLPAETTASTRMRLAEYFERQAINHFW